MDQAAVGTGVVGVGSEGVVVGEGTGVVGEGIAEVVQDIGAAVAEGIELVLGDIEVAEGIAAEVLEGIGVDHDLEEHRELAEEHNQVEGVVDHILVEEVDRIQELHILPGVEVGEGVQSEASEVSVAWVRVQGVQILDPLVFPPRGWGSRGTG